MKTDPLKEAPAAWLLASSLLPWAKNPRKNTAAVAAVARSIERFGFGAPIVARAETREIIAGHTRLLAAKQLGMQHVPVRLLELSEEEAHLLALADNKLAEIAEWDAEALAELARGPAAADMLDLGWTPEELAALAGAGKGKEGYDVGPPGESAGSLAERFGAPPFSILDARQGYWQERKRAWLSLGLDSVQGRPENLLGYSPLMNAKGPGEGTSIFDPVLCELMYLWFCPPGGLVLDPFAGGSVRGIVASRLGRQYVGIDLRAEQVAENREQAGRMAREPQPVWQQGDAAQIAELARGARGDFLFSCPPYADLERYSDDPRDLSTMAYPQFREAYAAIIKQAASLLLPDRFACFVVGEIRGGKAGAYRGFVPDTIRAFEAAGLSYYNEAVFITPAGSLPLRAAQFFQGSRKLGKSHQNVLVFVKGDAKRATAACGEVYLPPLEGAEGEAA